MKKSHPYYTVLKNTSLALATGLFTGGIVTQIVSDQAKGILLEAFFPALVFYNFYLSLAVFEYRGAKKSDPLVWITLSIMALFPLYLIVFRF